MSLALTGEFSNAIKKSGLHLGLYHSLFEWFNPLYIKDKANNFNTQDFVTVSIIYSACQFTKLEEFSYISFGHVGMIEFKYSQIVVKCVKIFQSAFAVQDPLGFSD